MRAGLAFTLISSFSFLATHAVVIHAPVAPLSAMPPKRKNVSNLGKHAEKVSRLPSSQEDVAAAEATTEAYATMNDYDTAAAADDEVCGDSDGTHSSEDEDDKYEDGDDYEDDPDGGGGSKITSWFQRVYEAGLTF